MLKQKQLRIVEMVTAVLLFGSIFLFGMYPTIGKVLNVALAIFLCLSYLIYHPVYFLDEDSKFFPTKRGTRKKFGFGVTLYSQLAAFTCCLICLFGTRMMLIPMVRLTEAVYILSIFLGGFFVLGAINYRNKDMLNVLLDGMRSMIIVVIPYSFYLYFRISFAGPE